MRQAIFSTYLAIFEPVVYVLLGGLALPWLSLADEAHEECSPSFQQIALSEPSSETQFDFSVPASPKILGDKLIAVHATNFLPKEGIVTAGASNISGPVATIDNEPASFRPTTHWALGGVVQEHRHSWEDKPYAVLIPFHGLKHQTVNITPADTYTLGDVRLPAGATVLIPKGQTHQLPKHINVVEYDPKNITLRAAVDAQIEKLNGWKLTLPKNKPGHDGVVKIEGKTVDFSQLIDELIDSNPHLSEGSHVQSVRGYAYRFGVIEQSLAQLANQFKPHSFIVDTATEEFLRQFIEHNLRVLDSEIAKFNFPKESLERYEEKKAKLRGWLNLIDADLRLRKLHGVTFSRSDSSQHEAIINMRNQPEALKNALEKELALGSLTPLEQSKKISSTSATEWMTSLPKTEFEIHYEKLKASNWMSETELANLRILYAINRIILVGSERAKAEGLPEMIGENLVPARPAGWDSILIEEIIRSIGRSLDADSTQLPNALQAISLPKVREAIKQHYGAEIPTAPKLEALLRILPQTKLAFEDPDYSSLDQTSIRILKRLGVNIEGTGKPEEEALSSFETASWNAHLRRYATQRTQDSVVYFTKPMNSTRDLDSVPPGDVISIYEQMSRGDFGTPEVIWQKLGLKNEYRNAFPTDEAFWKSEKSFKEIYEDLSLQTF